MTFLFLMIKTLYVVYYACLHSIPNGLINCFATKVRPLAEAKTFPIDGSALDAFVLLKFELLKSSLQSIDESLPFVIECDASDVAILASLNQNGCPVVFSLGLCSAARNITVYEKEATAVIETVKKWSRLLS